MLASAFLLALLSPPSAAQLVVAKPVKDRCWELTHQADLTKVPASAFDELVSCLSRPESRVRYEVITAFERPGVLRREDFMDAVLPAGRRAVALVPRDPDLGVRYASGGLSNDLTYWENRRNPARPPIPTPPGPFTRIFRGVFWAIMCFPIWKLIYRFVPKPPPEMRGKL